MKHYIISILLIFISHYSFSQKWNIYNDSLSQYFKTGEYKKGIIVGEKAIDAAKLEFGETHPNYVTSLNNLAVLFQASGQYEEAEPLFIVALETWKKIRGDSSTDYALSLNNLATLYQIMGQYEKAEPMLINAINIQKTILGEFHPDYAQSLNNLAELYRAVRQYEKAEPLYIQSSEICSKVLGETHPKYALSLNNLAMFYQDLGQYEKALPLFKQSAEIYIKTSGEIHPDYAGVLNNLAILYKEMGQYELAIKMYAQALKIQKQVLGETHPDYANSLSNLALICQSLGLYDDATTLYFEVLDIRKQVYGESHPEYAKSLNNLGLLCMDMKRFDNAEVFYKMALGILRKVYGENSAIYCISLRNLALLYYTMGRFEEAGMLYLFDSRVVLEDIRNTFTILSEKEKGNYLLNNISLVEINNSTLYNYRKMSSSFIINNFNLQLFFKSLSLTDARIMLESVSESKDSSLRYLFNEWQFNKRLMAKQYSLPIDNRRKDLTSIEAKTESQEKELSQRSSEFRTQQASLQVAMQDVQMKLQRDEAAIEFVRFRLFNKKWTDSTIYAAYILRKNDTVPKFVPLCEEKQLKILFDSAGNTATSMASSLYRGIKIKSRKSEALLGKELFNLIWQPMEPYLKGINKIAYSPSGKIYNVALHALPMDSVSVLMDKYQLQQYTSTRQVAFRNLESQNSKPGSIVLFGDASFTMDSLQLVNINGNKAGGISTSVYIPNKRGSENITWNSLPGTAEEVNKIKLLFNQNEITAKSFVQNSATEENLKALNGHSPQILHIATHGFFLPAPDGKKGEIGFDGGNIYTLADDPLLRSGLMFAGCNYAWSGKTPLEGVEDGIATAYEISQLNLSNTELVVLSACETALGDIKGSEGVFGLQRSFKMAGVKRMIVSLWQVPDKETAELMTTFYTTWLKGKSVTESFYDAQAEMRKKYSPYYWAAFVLVE